MTEVKKRAPRKKTLDLVMVKEYIPPSDIADHEFTAVGLIRYRNATYSQVTVKVKGERIVSMEVDEPNMRQIAIDSLKIACMKQVIDAATL